MMRIAIAGNPNSGKTTVFNSLSGRNERIGNWAGVTVEKKEAYLRRKFNPSSQDIIIVDLPGAYGMEAYTNDELEATEFIRNEHIDAIINVVDASNLERSLHLSMQLIETGVPVIIALNKVDIIKRRKTTIDIEALSELLGCDVHFTQATCKRGLFDVVRSAVDKSGIENYEKRGHYGQQKHKKRYKRHRLESEKKECRCK